MYMDKTEKAREPTVESLVRGIWRLRVSEAERRVREGVLSTEGVSLSHRDKMEQYTSMPSPSVSRRAGLLVQFTE